MQLPGNNFPRFGPSLVHLQLSFRRRQVHHRICQLHGRGYVPVQRHTAFSTVSPRQSPASKTRVPLIAGEVVAAVGPVLILQAYSSRTRKATLTSLLDDMSATAQMMLNATRLSPITHFKRRYGRDCLPARLYARHALDRQAEKPQGIFRLRHSIECHCRTLVLTCADCNHSRPLQRSRIA
jgi:hypothetical protein